MTQKNPFAEAANTAIASVTANSSFNVDVAKLPPGYRGAVHQAILEGELDCFMRRGAPWVSYHDIADLAGPGTDHRDPAGGCFIPRKAC